MRFVLCSKRNTVWELKMKKRCRDTMLILVATTTTMTTTTTTITTFNGSNYSHVILTCLTDWLARADVRPQVICAGIINLFRVLMLTRLLSVKDL